MEDDDDYFDSSDIFDVSTSDDASNTVCGAKNSSFEALTTEDIVELMNQFIADIDAVVQVRSMFHRNKFTSRLTSDLKRIANFWFFVGILIVASNYDSYSIEPYKMG